MGEQKLPQIKYKLLKWTIGMIVSVFILLSVAAWYINNRWKPIITDVIKNTLVGATDSLYKVEFSDIEVNILTGSVTIDDIEIAPNLVIYQKMIRQRIAPENIIDLKISKLSIKNANPIKVYRLRKLDINTINIEQPSLTVFYTKLKNQLEKKEKDKTAYERIKDLLIEVKIGSLFLSDVKFKYVDQSLKIPKTTLVDKVNIRLNNILINDKSAMDKNRIFTAKDVIAEINNYDFTTPDSMYHLNIKHVEVSTQKKHLIVEGICLNPRYNEMDFSEQYDYQQERYRLMFDSLISNNINFNALLKNRTFSTSNIELMNGEIEVFLNRDKEKKSIDKGSNFPHIALQRVAFGIIADTVVLKNINISYTEYNPKTKGRGTVFFKELDGRIFNVTNDSLALLKNHTSNVNVQTYLMGKGKLNLHIGFNLTDPKGAFSYDGDLGKMQSSTINSLTKPLAMLMTSSGEIEKMTFNMKGNINGAGGSLSINYKDLNVILMKRDEQENYKRMGLISLFANALILERDNPSKNKPLRVVNPYYNRPADGSFFNLMWKAIFLGAKESVGITKEKEAKLLERVENYKEAKENRAQRKRERLKRRNKKNN